MLSQLEAQIACGQIAATLTGFVAQHMPQLAEIDQNIASSDTQAEDLEVYQIWKVMFTGVVGALNSTDPTAWPQVKGAQPTGQGAGVNPAAGGTGGTPAAPKSGPVASVAGSPAVTALIQALEPTLVAAVQQALGATAAAAPVASVASVAAGS